MMDAQLADALADGFDVAPVPLRQTVEAGGNERAHAQVTEPDAPLAKGLGLLEHEHM